MATRAVPSEKAAWQASPRSEKYSARRQRWVPGVVRRSLRRSSLAACVTPCIAVPGGVHRTARRRVWRRASLPTSTVSCDLCLAVRWKQSRQNQTPLCSDETRSPSSTAHLGTALAAQLHLLFALSLDGFPIARQDSELHTLS